MTDITYIETGEVWLYLVAVLDRSMSRAGTCYDNAAVESFGIALKLDTQIDILKPAPVAPPSHF